AASCGTTRASPSRPLLQAGTGRWRPTLGGAAKAIGLRAHAVGRRAAGAAVAGARRFTRRGALPGSSQASIDRVSEHNPREKNATRSGRWSLRRPSESSDSVARGNRVTVGILVLFWDWLLVQSSWPTPVPPVWLRRSHFAVSRCPAVWSSRSPAAPVRDHRI